MKRTWRSVAALRGSMFVSGQTLSGLQVQVQRKAQEALEPRNPKSPHFCETDSGFLSTYWYIVHLFFPLRLPVTGTWMM